MGEAGSPPINRLAMHRLCLNERSTLSLGDVYARKETCDGESVTSKRSHRSRVRQWDVSRELAIGPKWTQIELKGKKPKALAS